MELKHLDAFVLVATHLSFSKACQHSGLSQPSLSRLVKQLEDELQLELFDRYHRPLQLTEAGKFFFSKVTILRNELTTITNLTKKIASPSNEFTIGFVPSVLYGLLPEIIANFKKSCATATVNLQDISSYKQVEALKHGKIDIGFGRFLLNDASIQQILLRHEKYVLALPHAHPLAAQAYQSHSTQNADEVAINLQQVINDTLILYHQTHYPTSTHKVTEPLLHIFAELGLTPHSTKQVSDLQVALGLVSAGEGVCIVPQSLKNERTHKITYLPIIHENATTPLYLQTLKEHAHPFAETLLQIIYHLYEDKGITYRRQQIT